MPATGSALSAWKINQFLANPNNQLRVLSEFPISNGNLISCFSISFFRTKWRAKYGGMDTSLIARLKELEAENTRLKKMYPEE